MAAHNVRQLSSIHSSDSSGRPSRNILALLDLPHGVSKAFIMPIGSEQVLLQTDAAYVTSIG
jgi:hypothetical protein